MNIDMRFTRDELPEDGKVIIFVSFGEVYIGTYDKRLNEFSDDYGDSIPQEEVQSWIYINEFGASAHEAFKVWLMERLKK